MGGRLLGGGLVICPCLIWTLTQCFVNIDLNLRLILMINSKISEKEVHIPDDVVDTTDGDLVLECTEVVWLRIDVVVLSVFVVTDIISELFRYGSIEN